MKNRAIPLAAALILAASMAHALPTASVDVAVPGAGGLNGGFCAPNDATCVNSFFSDPNQGGAGPIQTMDPITAPKPMYLLCDTVPYRPCTDAENKQKEDAKSQYGVPGGLIGPPAPDTPQPFKDSASFQQAMKEQEAATPGKVIDLGNNTYAADIGGGRYILGGSCTGGSCTGMPVTADKINGLQAALETQKANNNMFTASSNGAKAQPTPAGNPVTLTPDPTGDAPVNPSASATNDANVVADAQNLMASSGGAGGLSGGNGGGNGSGAAGGGTNENAVIKVNSSVVGNVNNIPITFTGNQPMLNAITNTSKTFKDGKLENFADQSGVVTGTAGKLETPPVDAKYLGKQQWADNSSK